MKTELDFKRFYKNPEIKDQLDFLKVASGMDNFILADALKE